MNILFIGSIDSYNNIEKYKDLSVAGNKYQLNFLAAIHNLPEVEVEILSIIPTRVYPYGKIFIKPKKDAIENLAISKIGYINFPFLKGISIRRSLYKNLIKKYSEKKFDVIITFNYFQSFSIPISNFVRRTEIKVIPILADLPVFHLRKKRNLKDIWTAHQNFKAKKAIYKLEHIIVLNPNAQKYFAPNAAFIQVEGGFNTLPMKINNNTNSKMKNFFYSGTLDSYSGINIFVDAFIGISKERNNIHLTVCGSGEYEEYMKSIDANHNNIKFLGKIKQPEVIKLQKSSYCLVNPKVISHPVSRVTFPSKLHEYMLNNSRIITTKLSGLSHNYLNNMYLIESDDLESYKRGILSVLNASVEDNYLKSKKLSQFMSNELTWDKQASKVIDFIRKINKNGIVK